MGGCAGVGVMGGWVCWVGVWCWGGGEGWVGGVGAGMRVCGGRVRWQDGGQTDMRRKRRV